MPRTIRCRNGHMWDLQNSIAGDGTGRAICCSECGSPPTLDSLGAPADVVEALDRLQSALQQSASDALTAVILYGGLARGRFLPGRSDVNLLLLLKNDSGALLQQIAPPLHRAWRSAGVEPWIITAEEVSAITDVFPTKLLDIRDHHILLFGEDPFPGVEIAPKYLRLRIEQELRNMAMRLRRRYIPAANDVAVQAGILRGIARPLAIELAALLTLCDCLPAEIRGEELSAQVFELAATKFELDGEALMQLSALRNGELAIEAAESLYPRVLGTVDKAAQAVDALEERFS